MKKCLLLVYILIASIPSMGAVFVVDNNNPSVYQDITSAINAASSGDTVYVQGSTVPYPAPANITKKIILIGSGHNPDKEAPVPSTIAGSSTHFASGSSGSVMMGFFFTADLRVLDTDVDSLVIADNRMTGLNLKGSNHIVEGNAILGGCTGPGPGYGNIICRNNIITWQIGNFTEPTIVFTNNIYLNGGIQTFGGSSNITIKNSIFYKGEPTGSVNATYLNNICFQTTDTIPFGTNTGSGNINNADPEFVYIWSGTVGFDYSYDFHLQPTSPGKNAGTDGTDIGVYGGLSPFKQGGEPPIPLIKVLNIENTTVPVGGNLDITVEGEVQQ